MSYTDKSQIHIDQRVQSIQASNSVAIDQKNTTASVKPQSHLIKRGHFAKDLRPMIYGFGDVPYPRQDTVDMVESCLLEYLASLVDQAFPISQRQRGSRPKPEDLLHTLRRDLKKHGRMEELIYMNEELKKVRRAFETEE